MKKILIFLLMLSMVMQILTITSCNDSAKDDDNDNSKEDSQGEPISKIPESSEWLVFSLNEDGDSYSVINTNQPSASEIVVGKYNNKPVTKIGANAFERCINLTSVSLSSCVESIEEYAFRGCTSLTNLTLNSGVKSIGSYAFADCEKLKNIVWSENIETIGSHAFYGCSELSDILLNSVKSIGEYAFHDCIAVNIVKIGEYVDYIGGFAFSGSNIKHLYISPNFSAEIRKHLFYTFYDCEIYNAEIPTYMINTIPREYLRKLVFNTGENIMGDQFADYLNLTHLTIPASVQTIAPSAFGYSPKLISVVIEDPNGWTINGELIPSSDLSCEETAAEYLKDNLYMVKVRT